MQRAATAVVCASRRSALQQTSSGSHWVRNCPSKDVRFGVEASALVLQGVEQSADAVRVTMGPKLLFQGRKVAIERSFGSLKVNKDGVTVAKAIDFNDIIKKVGTGLVKQFENATNDTAGNGLCNRQSDGISSGTMCATVHTEAIFSEGYKTLPAGMKVTDVRRGINLTVDAIVAILKTRVKMIRTTEEIAQVGTIAANGEQEIGDLIARAMEKVGKQGDGKTLIKEFEVVDGMKLDRGYVSPYFTTCVKSQELRKPRASKFDHKVIRKARWADGWSTPAWVKPRLKLITQGRLQSRASYGTRDWSQDTAQEYGSRHVHTAGTTREAIDVLKNRLQRGTTTDSYTYVKVLQMCLQQEDLLAVKQVHHCISESGMDKNPYVANNLLNVYIRCGGFLDARRVFEELEKKSVITWNMMIAGYAKRDHAALALELFNQMRQEGVQPNEITYLSILKACSSPLALKWGKEVHVCIRHSGFESDVRVGTALLQMYAKCGSIKEARRVFEKLSNRDVITWNIMIGAYAEGGRVVEAYQLFLQMRQEGFEPDPITYVSILNASASKGPSEWVKEVHRHARKAGLESDLRVGNALLHFYAKSGGIDEARLFFDRLEKRDVVTWTIMIGGLAQHGCGHEAYRLFLQMKREGFEPDAFTFASILNASTSVMPLEWVKEVHAHARKAGMESDLRVGNALVHMYAKSGGIDDARLVFDRMEKRDVVTWTIMIGALAQHGCGHEAYGLFVQMRREGFEPDAFTYASLLNAPATEMSVEWVREVHGQTRKAGLDSDLRVGNALIHIYAKHGVMNDARVVFDRMKKRDLFTWTIMIGALAQHGCGHEAYGLFVQMRQEGFEPDAITYTSILNASASVGALEWVKEVHGHARKAGLDTDLQVGNALVHMYAKSGSIDDARLVFDRMEKLNLFTWTIMIGGLAQHGCGHEALKLFQKMIADGVKPDGTSFAAVLSACCHAGLLDEGRRLFLAMTDDYGIQPDIVHCTCMVDLLGRAGHLEEAKRFISDMPVEPNEVTWKALLGACRTFGNVELGELAANNVFKLEPDNASAYVLLSNIYAAAGKWEKVSSVRSMMQKRGVWKEPGCSWIEVDNKIHEFVVGDTSHTEAKVIYTYLENLTEKLKAEGYIPNTQLVLQNIDEEDKELALCSHSEKLAIAYGLMRVPRGRTIRVYKNLRVCSDCHTATKVISKVTGREIIARDANRFHHFKDGVCSCGDYW